MSKDRPRRPYKKLSPEKQAWLDKVHEEVDAELPEIKAQAKAYLQKLEGGAAIMSALRAERERQGLTIDDLSAKSGIDKEIICDLENEEFPTPDIRTLARLASRLGKRVEYKLVDPDPRPTD